MTAFEISISSAAPHFVQENEIFGKAFFLEFEWIENEEFWLMHIGDGNEQPLSNGIKLQADWPLYTHRDGPTAFNLMLLTTSPLNRTTLREQSILVAYAL